MQKSIRLKRAFFPQYGAKSGSGMLISTSVEGLVAPRKSAKRDAGPQPGRENFSLAANEVFKK